MGAKVGYLQDAKSKTRRVSTAIADLQKVLGTGVPHPTNAQHLQQLTDYVCTLTRATGVSVALKCEDGIRCVATSGQTGLPLGSIVDTETGISGHCIRTATVQLCRDTERDERVNPLLCRRLTVRSILVAPIATPLGVRGLVEALSSEPHKFDTWCFNFLQAVAELLGEMEFVRAGTAHLPIWKAGMEGGPSGTVTLGLRCLMQESLVDFVCRKLPTSVVPPF